MQTDRRLRKKAGYASPNDHRHEANEAAINRMRENAEMEMKGQAMFQVNRRPKTKNKVSLI